MGHNKKSQNLYWYWPYIHEKSVEKCLDIHPKDKSDKRDILAVVTCSIFDIFSLNKFSNVLLLK